MANIDLAKKALTRLKERDFDCGVVASTGWDDNIPIYLSESKLAYLIKKRMHNDELFSDIICTEFDLKKYISEEAREAAFPDGGPTASLRDDAIPDELVELSERIENCDIDDEEEVEELREMLSAVTEGEYTFHFEVSIDSDYCCASNVEETFHLTADEARGLLNFYFDEDHHEIFEGICEECTEEDYINELAEKKGFAEEYNNISISYECPYIENYLDAWVFILQGILDGEISEDNLDEWVAYFDDNEEPECSIQDWHKYQCD